MPKKIAPLKPLDVQRIAKAKERGYYSVGVPAGLGLQVAKGGSSNWVLRVTIAGKRREMGLGGYPDVQLADAQRLARDAREAISKGDDPITGRREARSARKVANAAALTFKECALSYVNAHESGWRNPKHTSQWRNTLETYAYPTLGKVLVRDVTLPLVLGVLEPIWNTKTETASRLRGRLESILDWAKVREYRAGDNPARWSGNLDAILPAPGKVAKAEHYAALSIDAVGAFLKDLRAIDGISARALELAILTAARAGEVRGATWAEIDLQAAEWRIPGDRMKAGKEHRVPLSAPAVALLKALPEGKRDELVFPSPRGGKLSDMSMTAILRRLKVAAVPHGFRSTFRDWAAERTHYPHEVAEMALAHAIASKVEAAYRRGDLFDKRRQIMNDWAAFCARPVDTKGAVVPMTRTKRSNTAA